MIDTIKNKYTFEIIHIKKNNVGNLVIVIFGRNDQNSSKLLYLNIHILECTNSFPNSSRFQK